MKRTILFIVFLVLSAHLCSAQVPRTLSYQGKITLADGTSVDDGTYTLTFRLYDVSSGGTALWTETQSVEINDGVFDVILGSENTLNLPFDRQYWLGVTVGDESEMSPRTQLTSSGYSFIARSVSDKAITSGKIADNAVVKSINDLRDAVTLIGGNDIEITKVSNSLTISSTAEEGLTLPYSQSLNQSSRLFSITNYGSGDCIAGYNYGSGLAGRFTINNSNSSNPAVYCTTNGKGNALKANTSGSGWAAWFEGTGAQSNGVKISSPYGTNGLNVIGGSKTAVVATSSGARKLYTEESTEVWFTDYGFGSIDGGSVTVDIDPTFAETVRLDEPYHVFVQPYGDAVLYVSSRKSGSFEVHVREGQPGLEFSYRIVAKRKGYENARMEREPALDNDPNL